MAERGAQPGNLNAAKSVVPAIRRLLAGKPLTAELMRVIELVEMEEDAITADLGGRDNITSQEQALLNSWKTCRSVEMLVMFELFQKGAIVQREGGEWDLQPAIGRLGKFLSEGRQTLQALGLERRAKSVTDLATYIKQREASEGEK